jgi:hypothetical protein
MSTETATLFSKFFDSVTEEFEPEDYASIETPSCRIHLLQSGQVVRLMTFAARHVIIIGTPLGSICIEQAYPKDSSRIRMTGSKAFKDLFPNPTDDYLTLTDLYNLFGNEELKYGVNIGQRLADAFSDMLHRSIHNPNGKPYEIALDEA